MYYSSVELDVYTLLYIRKIIGKRDHDIEESWRQCEVLIRRSTKEIWTPNRREMANEQFSTARTMQSKLMSSVKCRTSEK